MAAVAAVLLAAGRSARMGRDKTAIRIDGERLVDRHLRQLRSVGVTEAVVVYNRDNTAPVDARTVVQAGEGMSAAVRTGLAAIGSAGEAWLVCVNDIVADADYARVAARPLGGGGMVIAAARIDRPFQGGMLDLTAGSAVRRIVEKPPGGCPPGSMANIMIHRFRGAHVIAHLSRAADYESAVNELIASGVPVQAAIAEFWVALKTPEDLVEASMRGLEVA